MLIIGASIIQKATEVLLAVAPAGSRVILFGSHATGKADASSDIDFLVVEPNVQDRVKEMLRLTEALRPTKLPVDLLVLSSDSFERWKNTPNSIAYRVAREGKVYGPAT
jgi:predicted nucleotidyltransferase